MIATVATTLCCIAILVSTREVMPWLFVAGRLLRQLFIHRLFAVRGTHLRSGVTGTARADGQCVADHLRRGGRPRVRSSPGS